MARKSRTRLQQENRAAKTFTWNAAIYSETPAILR